MVFHFVLNDATWLVLAFGDIESSCYNEYSSGMEVSEIAYIVWELDGSDHIIPI